MLVFKDEQGQMWRIAKLEEEFQNFDDLINESEFDLNYFKPKDDEGSLLEATL